MQKSHSGRETFEFYLDKSRVMYDSNLSLSVHFKEGNQGAGILYTDREKHLLIFITYKLNTQYLQCYYFESNKYSNENKIQNIQC